MSQTYDNELIMLQRFLKSLIEARESLMLQNFDIET